MRIIRPFELHEAREALTGAAPPQRPFRSEASISLGKMKRVIIASLFVGTSLGQSIALGQSAANETTEKIIALSENKRNEFWTLYLQQSGRTCDTAVRSMFQGGSDNDDDYWSVACGDGNSYSVGIAAGPEGTTTLMACDELVTMDAALFKLSGSRSDEVGCWKQFAR